MVGHTRLTAVGAEDPSSQGAGALSAGQRTWSPLVEGGRELQPGAAGSGDGSTPGDVGDLHHQH